LQHLAAVRVAADSEQLHEKKSGYETDGALATRRGSRA
jgi:hypothetical protein